MNHLVSDVSSSSSTYKAFKNFLIQFHLCASVANLNANQQLLWILIKINIQYVDFFFLLFLSFVANAKDMLHR